MCDDAIFISCIVKKNGRQPAVVNPLVPSNVHTP
jgi:hypothetical protein